MDNVSLSLSLSLSLSVLPYDTISNKEEKGKDERGCLRCTTLIKVMTSFK